jgi:hypothetical protein
MVFDFRASPAHVYRCTLDALLHQAGPVIDDGPALADVDHLLDGQLGSHTWCPAKQPLETVTNRTVFVRTPYGNQPEPEYRTRTRSRREYIDDDHEEARIALFRFRHR